MNKVDLNILQQSLPKKLRNSVTQKTVDIVNNITNDEDEIFVEQYRNNFVDYLSVMQSGEFQIKDYISAVKYVSHKLMGCTNIDSYMYTYPKRYKRLLDKYSSLPVKEIRTRWVAPYAKSFNDTRLVNRIMEQTLIPSHVLNAGYHQEGINMLVNKMRNGRSERIQLDATVALIAATKAPETSTIKIDMAVDTGDAIADLRKVTQELALQQQMGIQTGANTTREIAHSKIFIEAEIEDAD